MSSLPYTVEIDASAWTQLGALRVETYRRVREALKAVASALTREGSGTSPRRSLHIDDTVALYEVDAERRRVLLRRIGGQETSNP